MDLKGFFTNVPKSQLYMLVGLLSAMVLAGWWFFLFKPASEERDRLRNELAGLEQQLFQKKRISQDRPRLQREIAEREAKLKQASLKLPAEKEIPSLLTHVNTLGQESGLAFSLFRPSKPVQKEFFVEIPIKIRAEGTYHALGAFFEKLGTMDRIVSVADLRITQAQAKGKDRRRSGTTVSAEFTAKTFTFGKGGT